MWLILVVVSVLAPWITPYSYEEFDETRMSATPPGAEHLLGTDTIGRDLLTRLIYGGRISLAIGLCATGVSLLIGVIYGAISGYFGGKVDTVMMRFVDVMYSLPYIIFVILLMTAASIMKRRVEDELIAAEKAAGDEG